MSTIEPWHPRGVFRGDRAPGRRVGLLLAGLTMAACAAPARQDAQVRVAAAADLSRALPDVAAAFTAASGTEVALTFGSCVVLATQLVQGAPFDAFASADEAFANQATASGACRADTKQRYARGRLVAWWRADAPLTPPASLADLADPRFRHVALANPEHAPYGRAAKQALEAAGVWTRLAARLVYGENVRQALQFAESGNADVALVAASLAEGAGGRTLPIDGALHAPLTQTVVACVRGEHVAGGAAFAAFLAGPDARAILQRHGFDPPDVDAAGDAPRR